MNKILDFGPIYTETDLANFPVEPWNTFSNVIFLIALIYFAKKTKLDCKKHYFLVWSLPLLGIGFIGGTIYHATRSSNIWLIMDFVPIALLSLAAMCYFWWHIFYRKLYVILAVLLTSLLPRFFIWSLDIDRNYIISLSYVSMGLALCLPITVLSFQHKWLNWHLTVIAFLFFSCAVFFRLVDKMSGFIFPMGTHFLWHLFGGCAVFCLMEFIYRWNLIKEINHEK